MAVDGSIVIDVDLNADTANRDLDNINRQLNNVGSSGPSVEKLAASFYLVQQAARATIGFVKSVADTAFSVGSALVQAAGSAQALNSQFTQVFGNLEGAATASLNQIARDTNILPTRLQESFTRIAAFARTTGVDTAGALDLTTRATIAAADSAAFYDRSIESTTESLQSFLKGNFENDAALGISATETTRNAVANQLYGKSFRDLDEAQKQIALLTLVEQGNELSGALGQAAREGEGLENVTGNLQQAFTDLQARLGDRILEPVIGQLVRLTNIITNLDTDSIVNRFVAIGTTIAGFFTNIYNSVLPFLEQIVGAFTNNLGNVQGIVEGFGSFLQGYFDLVVTTVSNIWNQLGSTIFDYIVNLLGEVVAFVSDQLNVIAQFWEENGAQISQAVQNFANIVLGIFQFFLPAILFLVDTVWAGIQSVIRGAISVIQGIIQVFAAVFTLDIGLLWDGIVNIFRGAIDLILGFLSLTFVGGIRNLFISFGRTAVNFIRGIWDDIIKLFRNAGTNITNAVSSAFNSILSFARNLFTNFVETIRNLQKNTLKLVSDLAKGMVDGIVSLPGRFLQIGTDIMQGLINGLKKLNPVKIIGDIAGSMVDRVKGIFDINSPSKVFTQIGVFNIQGLANGMSSQERNLTKVVEDLGKVTLDFQNKSNKNLLDNQNKYESDKQKIINDSSNKAQKAVTDANQKISKIQADARSKGRELTIKQANDIAIIETNLNTRLIEINTQRAQSLESIEVNYIKQQQDLQQSYQKDYLTAVTQFVADRKSTNDLNINEERRVWESVISTFTEGSQERIKAQQNYSNVLKNINDQIIKINQDYQKQIQAISDEETRNIEKLSNAYLNSENKRFDQLRNFSGLFKEFTSETKVTGEDLIFNLQTQVSGLEAYSNTINSLAGRGIGEELLNDLRGLGVGSLAELQALNNLTDSQLAQFEGLFQQRTSLARQQAQFELRGLRTDTENEIEQLRANSVKQLEVIQNQWVEEIKGITEGTRNELNNLYDVGNSATKNLLDGLNNLAPDLINRAKEIASQVGAALSNTLGLNTASNLSVALPNSNPINYGSGLSRLTSGLNSQSSDYNNNSSVNNNNNNQSQININVQSDDAALAVEQTMRRIQFGF